MAGNALAKLYSWADGVKRRVSNPLETIALGITRAGEDLGAAATDADIAYGRNGMKSVLLSEQQKAEAAKRAAQFGEQMAMAAATVWHGSPHKFDKFDSSKIGTGEGAQAYGHGLYLAESPTVATGYKETLARQQKDRLKIDGQRVDPDSMLGRSAEDVSRIGLPATLQKIDDNIKFNEKYAPDMADMWRGIRTQVEKLDPSRVSLMEGQLYKVDLPDDAIAKMLDWDKPLSQQGGGIDPFIDAQKASLESLPSAFGPTVIPREVAADIIKNKTGSQAYDLLKQQYGAAKAAEMLRQAGIPGIRYLDGGSRGAGQGSSNFVVFPGNEKLLRILERNGQALP